MTGPLIVFIVWVATLLAALFYGEQIGENRFAARQLREEHIVAVASEAAASAAAKAIGSIEVRNVTITNQLQREVQTREIFRECRSGSAALGLLNSTPGVAAAPAGAEPAASGVVPKAVTPAR